MTQEQNTPQTLAITIPTDLAGSRLDQAIAQLLPDYSRSQIQNWIKSGLITINTSPVRSKDRVQGGETINIVLDHPIQTHDTAEPIPLIIVYEDDAILIINKPIGMVVHPGAGNASQTLLNALLHHEPSLAQLPRAGILHRIDKGTSGLLVVAKTIPAYQSLSKQLKHKTLRREYQAIVCGTLISGGMVDAPIGRHPIQRKRMAINDINGKEAITHYRVQERYRAHTRLLVRLETGRTHQIRVHMAHIRHPIIGDATYGGRLQLAKGMSDELITYLRQYKHQALHAATLGLIHPVTEETMTFEAPLPDDMVKLIALLNADSKGKHKK